MKVHSRKRANHRLSRTNFVPRLELLERREVFNGTFQGPSSSQTPYLIPTAAGVEITSIMTVGDSVNNKTDGVTPYKAVGIMDGLGAYDNGDGTFTLLMNHELAVNTTGNIATPAGIIREHGNAGAFVSLWTINKSDLSVVKIEDFLQDDTSIYLSNNMPSDTLGAGVVHSGFLAGDTTVLARLCSADLAAPSAYQWFDASTGTFYGTSSLIFQTGEESGGTAFGPAFVTSSNSGAGIGPEGRVDFGRQFAFIANDDPLTAGVNEARTAYELPHSGLFSWENNIANPLSQLKTIVAGMDDSTPGQIYFWIGDKQVSGNVVERAGLTRQSAIDSLYVVKADGLQDETANGAYNGNFQLLKSGNDGDVSALTWNQLDADSNSKGGTRFFRPEDGQWDPNNPNDYYFVTTANFAGPSRLYRLRFSDIANPEAGGTITTIIDGGVGGHRMFDNMTMDQQGRIIMQEDPGNNAYLARVWMYDIASGALLELAQHDSSRFVAGAPNFLTQDEESSGVIDVSDILGPGTYLLDVQAHFNPGNPELVEGGQLLMMRVGAVAGLGFDGATGAPALVVLGTTKNDHITISQTGTNFNVKVGNNVLGTIAGPSVTKVFAVGYDGNDHIDLSGVNVRSRIVGNDGNDHLTGGSGVDEFFGGLGNDKFNYDLNDLFLDFGVGNDHKKKKK